MPRAFYSRAAVASVAREGSCGVAAQFGSTRARRGLEDAIDAPTKEAGVRSRREALAPDAARRKEV